MRLSPENCLRLPSWIYNNNPLQLYQLISLFDVRLMSLGTMYKSNQSTFARLWELFNKEECSTRWIFMHCMCGVADFLYTSLFFWKISPDMSQKLDSCSNVLQTALILSLNILEFLLDQWWNHAADVVATQNAFVLDIRRSFIAVTLLLRR